MKDPKVYRKVTRRTWGQRLRGSVRGIFFGFLVMAAAFLLLTWNEGRAVRRARTLSEGEGVVRTISAELVAAENDGRLVYLSGTASTPEILVDPDFGISVNAVHLERQVEMYQWVESSQSHTEKQLGGSTETVTTYTYATEWRSRAIDSSSFEVSAGHENPPLPYVARTVSAQNVTVGAFGLSPGLIAKIGPLRPLPAPALASLPWQLRYRAQPDGGALYLGRHPRSPELGDARISFRAARPGEVSVVAGQRGSLLGTHRTEAGGAIEMLSNGRVPVEELFRNARQFNRVMTWIVRLVGFLIMSWGLSTVLYPLSVVADVVPKIGDLVEAATGAVARLLAAALSLATIGVAWIYHRPAIGIPVLILAGTSALAGIVWLIRKVRSRARRPAPRGAVPPPVPPPPQRSTN